MVLFFDNVDTLDPSLIDKLIGRLDDQTSSVYVVSTCDPGSKELRVRSVQQGPRPYFFESVYLGTLSKELSNEIFAEVWKGKGSPLLADLSLPGYIVSGSNPVLGKIRSLPEEDKKVIQALRLAAGCGVVECDEKLFWGMLADVLGSQPQDRPACLDRFIEQGMILVQDPGGSAKRILVQHTSYLDEAYDDLSKFRRDLARLADWLFEQRDSQRMAALGSHYWNVLFDSSSGSQHLRASGQAQCHGIVLSADSCGVVCSGRGAEAGGRNVEQGGGSHFQACGSSADAGLSWRCATVPSGSASRRDRQLQPGVSTDRKLPEMRRPSN